jgi:thiamine pyrophosphokinase
MAQDFPQPTSSLASFPLTCSSHITCQQLTDAELGVLAILASNSIAVLFLTSTDGRVQHLTSTYSRPTDGVARAGWRRVIHEWRSRARV